MDLRCNRRSVHPATRMEPVLHGGTCGYGPMTLTNEVAEGKFFGYRAHRYFSQSEQVLDELDNVMRDAFIAGFESGAKWGIRTSAKLSDPSFREAITAVAEGLRRDC